MALNQAKEQILAIKLSRVPSPERIRGKELDPSCRVRFVFCGVQRGELRFDFWGESFHGVVLKRVLERSPIGTGSSTVSLTGVGTHRPMQHGLMPMPSDL